MGSSQAPEAISLGRRKCCPLGGFSRLSNQQSWHVPESSMGTLSSKAWPPLLSLHIAKSVSSYRAVCWDKTSLLGSEEAFRKPLGEL